MTAPIASARRGPRAFRTDKETRVVFRSAKERPFAERKATLRRRLIRPPFSPRFLVIFRATCSMSNSSPNHDPDKTLPPPTDVLPTGPPQDETQADEHQLVEILDRYLAELKAGTAPSRDELIQRHPHLAERLEACLAGLEFIHRTELAGPDSPQRLGDFRLLREVGRGGMGAVYEAEQISLGRRVAVKVLRFGAVSDPEAVDRFRREAETVARLHHTNIVPIFFVGSEGGVNYYAMQFIEGRSLADVLAQRTEPLDVQTVAEWGLQAAEALAHAHQRDVIHRDVKPSNLLLDEEGRIWLTDFGLGQASG